MDAGLGEYDSGASRVEVDVDGLAEFAASLRADLERNFVGHYQVVRAKVAGATQPVPAAIEIVKAREVLGRRLAECVQGLADHVMAAGWLAAAADELTRRYAEADTFAAVRVEDVAALMPPPGRVGSARRAI